MKKRLLITSALMTVVLGASLATGTYAWYASASNAGVSAAAATGNLTTTTTTIEAGAYTINFTISPADSELELSHVVTAAEASAGLNGAGVLAEGDLVCGVVNDGGATMRKVTVATNYITQYTVSAEWAVAPTDPADIAYLNGKTFTIGTTVTGNAKLLASNELSELENETTGSVTFTIAFDGDEWSFEASDYVNQYVHIEPTSISATETGTVGAVTIAAGNITFNS